MYLTVIRLYHKYELDRASPTDRHYEYMQSQFEYAKDHIEQLRVTSGLDGQGTNQSSEAFENSGVNVKHQAISGFAEVFMQVALLLIFFFGLQRILGSERGSNSMKGDFEFKQAADIDARLDDVKGIDEIKQEITDLIRMLKNPTEYTSKGAKMHKGVLLFGAPGTGKTLLSRAIAGEAGVAFLYCTGSSFDEMFVGVGAKRVRELFEQARKNKPCIIFIDEIDTLLSSSRRFGSEHSSSRATINSMLTEMDGFQKNDNILVIGATNHQDALDPAAVRPGRFDKKIHVPSPDVNGRTDIFKIYLDKVALAEGVEAKQLA